MRVLTSSRRSLAPTSALSLIASARAFSAFFFSTSAASRSFLPPAGPQPAERKRAKRTALKRRSCFMTLGPYFQDASGGTPALLPIVQTIPGGERVPDCIRKQALLRKVEQRSGPPAIPNKR